MKAFTYSTLIVRSGRKGVYSTWRQGWQEGDGQTEVSSYSTVPMGRAGVLPGRAQGLALSSCGKCCSGPTVGTPDSEPES